MENPNQVTVELDPHDQFSVEQEVLREMCGLVPSWLKADDEDPLFRQISKRYGFPVFEMDGEVVEGIYFSKYDEDPPLHPIAKISVKEHDNETVYMYEYGLVAVVGEDGNFSMARFD